MSDLQPMVASVGDVVEASLAPGQGAWTMGVIGAVAEHVVDGSTTVQRKGDTVEAIGRTGGLRIEGGPAVQLFRAEPPEAGHASSVVLATPRVRAAAARHVVTRLGVDTEALDERARGDVLVDLGLGLRAAAFLVRSADPVVLDRLARLEGRPWLAATHDDVDVLVARSPHRVVTSAVGRIEVYAPIPIPTGTSPLGCHTHLLPLELEHRRELPDDLRLPEGHVAGAVFHPAPPRFGSVGRPH